MRFSLRYCPNIISKRLVIGVLYMNFKNSLKLGGISTRVFIINENLTRVRSSLADVLAK